MAGGHRPGYRSRSLPSHGAGHRPGRAGAADLHHRASVHPAGGEHAGPPQAAAADLVGRRPGHGGPRRRARGGCAVRRRDGRQSPGVGDSADRHRHLRGGGDHRRRADAGKRARGGVRPGGRLRLRADRDADEERGSGPAAGHRAVLRHLAAVRDRGGRGRRPVPAAERPAGGLARRRPTPAYPRRRADQRLLRRVRLRRGRADRRVAARDRDRRRDRSGRRLHRTVPLAGPDPRRPARGITREPAADRIAGRGPPVSGYRPARPGRSPACGRTRRCPSGSGRSRARRAPAARRCRRGSRTRCR